jgi:hypothetical protein
MQKVISACEYARDNPRLTIKDLAKLVDIPERTLTNTKYSAMITSARNSGVAHREVHAENRKPTRKQKHNPEDD